MECTVLKREGNKGLGSDTYRVRVVQKGSQSGSGWSPLVVAGCSWSLLVPKGSQSGSGWSPLVAAGCSWLLLVQKRSQSGSGWPPLVSAGRSWSLLVCRSCSYHGDELVILLAAPHSEVDDVKGCLRIDGVVEGSRLVVEKFGGIHGESREVESIRREAQVSTSSINLGVPTTLVRSVAGK
jgi:hypothetical protein